MAKRKRKPLPYWLAPGESRCEGCERRHVHSVEARCVVCDAVHCTFCVVIADGEAFCSSCHAEGGPPWRRAQSGKA